MEDCSLLKAVKPVTKEDILEQQLLVAWKAEQAAQLQGQDCVELLVASQTSVDDILYAAHADA